MKKVKLKVGMLSKLKTFVLMMALIFTALCSSLDVYADTSQEVTAARNGVLRVDLLYVDKDNNEYLLGSGSGFLINNDTIITCAHVVNLSAEQVDAAEEAIGGNFKKNYKDRLKIRVVVMRDVYVYATIKNQSEQTDFAILSLSDAIYDRAPLTLDTGVSIDSTMQVYALGFPAAPEYYQNVNTYTYDDVSVTDGKVTKLTTIGNVDMIQHSAVLGEGNSGGPLVTDDGLVVGVNNASVDNSYYYAISIDQVINALDALGIEYGTGAGGESVPEQPEEPAKTDDGTGDGAGGGMEEPGDLPEASADKTALDNAISEARQKDLNAYSEESAANFNEALSDAESVNSNAQATQIEVDSAVSRLQAATETLVEKASGLDMKMIMIIIAAVVVILIIVLVVVLAGGKKKTEAPVMRQPAAVPPAGNGPTPPVYTPPVYAPPVQEAGSGETTVLNAGAGETTLLGGGSTQSSAQLIRIKTGESISINRPEFVIGKEKSRVNYCISGDSSISRSHAKISANGGEYMVSDMRSTNGTFVNGVKVESGRPVALKNGDKLVLSEEEFEFRM